MAIITLSDRSPQVDVEQASHHLRMLHAGTRPDEWLSLVLLGAGRRERHAFSPSSYLHREAVSAADSASGLQDVVDGDERGGWNVYTACSAFRAVPERGRGTRADVSSVSGVWADLDVKPGTEGYFQSEDELLAYIARLSKSAQPTLEIASGSGGRHCYWLFNPDQRLGPDKGGSLLRRWLDFLRSEAQGRTIENVHDTTRILRLAGTVRWPKAEESGMMRPTPVVITKCDGPRYDPKQLSMLSEAATNEAQAVRGILTKQWSKSVQIHRDSLSLSGKRLVGYDEMVRYYNLYKDWAELLIPTGWTLYADESRCRYWTRPGKSREDGKSASTDYLSDEDVRSTVMTVYTNDPSLDCIRMNIGTTDTHGLCTKYHYALTMIYNGNEETPLREARELQQRYQGPTTLDDAWRMVTA